MAESIAWNTVALLERLIAFPTVSRDPNRALIDWIAESLRAAGVEATVIPNAEGTKANLHAVIGPADKPGVMLSGHTDVVPVEGQAWTKDPFALSEADGKLYGRGAADMKGFVASALGCALEAAKRPLAAPLHLAFSYDEEVGCLGVPSLVAHLASAPAKPAFCIVGEPTGMAVATGHKGKTALKAVFTGREAHSALAPTGLNALHLAADFVSHVRSLQGDIAHNGPRDGDYDVPYTTLHVGKLEGGVALNIVPNRAEVVFEIRNLAADDPAALLARLEEAAHALVAAEQDSFPEAAVEISQLFAYPGLDTPPSAEVVDFVKGLAGSNEMIKVAFGTEGGLFTRDLGTPTVVCGPGSMAQGHKPDEFVSRAQLERCDAMLSRLLERLEAGL